MKRFLEFMRSRSGTIVLFAAAAILLAVSSVGGARAALIYSQEYFAEVEMYDIGVALLENGVSVAHRDDYRKNELNDDLAWDDTGTGRLLSNMVPEGEQLKLGYTYPEKLSVQNTGNIDQYVRVTIYKYWVFEDPDTGEEVRDTDLQLSPELIDLHLVNPDVWQLDECSSTSERTVLYYRDLLKIGEKSKLFADSLTINGNVTDFVHMNESKSADGKVTTYTYDYNGAKFILEARVDAVQDHNAEDAVWSAWGRRVRVDNEKMSKPEQVN